ncbi:MAG: hypothetical protein P8125_13080 [Gemmatimonadota bacterium]
MSLGDGQIACSRHHAVVLHALVSSPFVHAYSSDGRLLWTDTLPDFHPVRVVELDGGRGVGFQRDPEHGSDYVIGALSSDRGTSLLVQVGHWDPDRPHEPFSEIRTYSYEPLSGVRQELPLRSHVLASEAGRVVIARSLPFPRLAVIRYDMEARPFR